MPTMRGSPRRFISRASWAGRSRRFRPRTVVEGIIRFADEARATQLIVGKSVRSRWFELRHGSVVDRLVRETTGVTVHVLPMEKESSASGGRGRAKAGQWGRITDYLISFVLVALVTLLGELIFSAESVTNVGLLFLLPVMAAASRYGLRVGLVTGLVSSLAYNFFFIRRLTHSRSRIRRTSSLCWCCSAWRW